MAAPSDALVAAPGLGEGGDALNQDPRLGERSARFGEFAVVADGDPDLLRRQLPEAVAGVEIPALPLISGQPVLRRQDDALAGNAGGADVHEAAVRLAEVG